MAVLAATSSSSRPWWPSSAATAAKSTSHRRVTTGPSGGACDAGESGCMGMAPSVCSAALGFLAGLARLAGMVVDRLGPAQGHRQLQDLVVGAALDVDVDVLELHVDVFLDHFEQFVAHQRQVVRGAARGALLGHDDAQAFARHRGGGFRPALQEIEYAHADQPPKTRWRKPFLGASMKRSGRSSPRIRATVSL